MNCCRRLPVDGCVHLLWDFGNWIGTLGEQYPHSSYRSSLLIFPLQSYKY